MFLGLPIGDAATLQKIALVINTVLLISALVGYEMVYTHASQKKRRSLMLLFPLLVVVSGILVFAVYKQVATS